MRKRRLKQLLNDANAELEQLAGSNYKLYVERETLRDENNRLKAEILKQKSNIDFLEKANAELSEAANRALSENEVLRDKQHQQNDLFGKALVQVQPETGPSRPNRSKLTDQEVKDIREAHRAGMKQIDIAENYGVNRSTISRIVRGVYH